MTTPPQLSAVRLPADSFANYPALQSEVAGGRRDEAREGNKGQMRTENPKSDSRGSGNLSDTRRGSSIGRAPETDHGGPEYDAGSIPAPVCISDDDTIPPESFTLYSPASIHVVYLAGRKYISFETLCGDKRIDVKPEQWEAFWRQLMAIGKRELGVEG